MSAHEEQAHFQGDLDGADETVTQQQQQQQSEIRGEDAAFEGINFWVSLNSMEKEDRRD